MSIQMSSLFFNWVVLSSTSCKKRRHLFFLDPNPPSVRGWPPVSAYCRLPFSLKGVLAGMKVLIMIKSNLSSSSLVPCAFVVISKKTLPGPGYLELVLVFLSAVASALTARSTVHPELVSACEVRKGPGSCRMPRPPLDANTF